MVSGSASARARDAVVRSPDRNTRLTEGLQPLQACRGDLRSGDVRGQETCAQWCTSVVVAKLSAARVE
ncbi:MAG: hypothetical protein COZ06_07525 [Armatimonadetes bacterium CG_4_10_14_3_um_filter_66_18]|nr:MAG: hypothetical protein COZ06_07525 [Armatimonadetes bacterium CG_4_10_14_3_um_filter_66_18]